MSANKGNDTILQGRVFAPLLKFAVPMMLAILLQALYGAVDLMVVGKFGDTTGVAAVSNGSQIMQAMTEVIIGLTMGVTVLIGRYVGAKDDESAAKTFGGAIKLFFVVGVLVSVTIAGLAPQIVRIMRVPAEAADKTAVYVRICGSGMIFITAFNVISSLFRGLGDSKSPLLFISIACAANIIGDLVLCGVFKLDAVGAAISTIFAQAVSVAFSVLKMKKDGLPFAFTKNDVLQTQGAGLNVMKVGGPIAIQNVGISISFLIILAIINTLGLVASASVGISEKLFTFLSLVPMSFMYALAAFVAQNVGAKQEGRAIKGLRAGMIASFAFGILTWSLTFFAGDFLASLFENDPVVITSTQSYLKGTSAEYLLVPFVFCFLGYFNGIGKTNFVLVEGLLSSFAVRIPLSYYLSRIPETSLMAIGFAVPISTASSALMCVVYYVFIRKKRLALDRL